MHAKCVLLRLCYPFHPSAAPCKLSNPNKCAFSRWMEPILDINVIYYAVKSSANESLNRLVNAAPSAYITPAERNHHLSLRAITKTINYTGENEFWPVHPHYVFRLRWKGMGEERLVTCNIPFASLLRPRERHLLCVLFSFLGLSKGMPFRTADGKEKNGIYHKSRKKADTS